MLTDGSASYTTDEYAGHMINVDTGQRFQSYVLSNTATTFTVIDDAATDTGAVTTDDFDQETRSTTDIGVDEWYDFDGDGLSDYDENNIHGTDPTLYDTDGDGLYDGYEIDNGKNPWSATAQKMKTGTVSATQTKSPSVRTCCVLKYGLTTPIPALKSASQLSPSIPWMKHLRHVLPVAQFGSNCRITVHGPVP